MKEVPGAKVNEMVIDFKKTYDKEIKPFWMAETELTSEVWFEVYTWASGDLDMNGIIEGSEVEGKYKFQNPGVYGRDHGKTGNLNGKVPISGINWRDAMVFCNAITEYHNELNTPDIKLQTVYNFNDEPIRNSTDTNAEICDYVEQDINANGFRLSTRIEWRCAASYIDGKKWNKGNHVSGDLTGKCGKDVYFPGLSEHWMIQDLLKGNFAEAFPKQSEVYGDYSWNLENSDVGYGLHKHQVAQKKPNALNIYDMSGNVSEFAFDLVYRNNSLKRIFCGGNIEVRIQSTRLASISDASPTYTDIIGLRLSKSNN